LPASYECIVRSLAPKTVDACVQSSNCPDEHLTDLVERIQLLEASLPPNEDVVLTGPPLRGVADSTSHDEYCRIRRVHSSNAPATFIRAVSRGYSELIIGASRDGSSLGPQHWRVLHASFECLLGFATGHMGVAASWESDPYPEIAWPPSAVGDPLERWISGHHVFLVLIQGLIVSLNCFYSAASNDSETAACDCLDLATLLMHGSGAALHYTADFPRSDYDMMVRPTMMPPNVQEGMSGVLARDHRYFVQVLHSNRSLIDRLSGSLKDKYSEFARAFSGTYDSHKLVCAHFGGSERPSLLNAVGEQSGVSYSMK